VRILKELWSQFVYRKGNSSQVRIPKDLRSYGSRKQVLGERKNREIGEAGSFHFAAQCK